MKVYPDRGWLIVVLLAGVISVMAFKSMQADILGLFHDDGVYAVTAQSIAAGTGYRIISVPGAPAQTKYPVLYPFLLSWIWSESPAFPANILLLKSVNAFSAFAVMLLSYSLFRRHTGRSGVSALAYVFLVGTNLMMISCADFALSDNLFEMFVMAALVLHDRGAGDRSSWSGAVMVSLGFLTRVSGASLIVAGLVWVVVEGTRRRAIVYAAIVSGLTLPWFVWRAGVPEATNPLLAYYTGYEPSALTFARVQPRQAWQIVSGNVRYMLASFDVSLLLYMLPVLRWLVGALVLLGACALIRRRRPVFLVLFFAVYTGAVINYPFAPGRYIMPLLPVVILALFVGVFAAQARLLTLRGARAAGPLIVGVCALPVALLMTLNLLWLRSYNRQSSNHDPVRGFGVRLTYGWSGFTETFEWVRNHTNVGDVLATPYDPMYYLYTGRKGVRPWLHHPETYFYPVGRAVPNLGDPVEIRDALNDLGVRYLVIDPLDGYAESVAAPKFFDRLLATYPSKPRLVFTSHDLAHRIYDLRPSPAPAVR